MKAVYKLNFDCGRMGSLTGVFVADVAHVRILVQEEIEVYFGEVLGKHSEVCGPIEGNEIIFISADPVVVSLMEDHNLCNGYNPFDYTTTGFEFEEYGMDDPDEEYDDWPVRDIIEQMIKHKAEVVK